MLPDYIRLFSILFFLYWSIYLYYSWKKNKYGDAKKWLAMTISFLIIVCWSYFSRNITGYKNSINSYSIIGLELIILVLIMIDFLKSKQRKKVIKPKFSDLSEEDKRNIFIQIQNRIETKGKLLNDVSEILFKYDPIGINFDTNIDEYDSEAEQIFKQLGVANSVNDLTKIIHIVFIEMFTKEVARDKSLYQPIAEEIWKLKNK
jgi:hypothetical protein